MLDLDNTSQDVIYIYAVYINPNVMRHKAIPVQSPKCVQIDVTWPFQRN